MKQNHETVTITVSKKFAANVKEVAQIFGYPKDSLGDTVEAMAGWVFENLVKDGGDLAEEAVNRIWEDEKKCRAFAKRVEKRIGDVARVYFKEGRGWAVRLFDKDSDFLALWDLCQKCGVSYNECQKVAFDRNLDFNKFLEEKIRTATALETAA